MQSTHSASSSLWDFIPPGCQDKRRLSWEPKLGITWEGFCVSWFLHKNSIFMPRGGCVLKSSHPTKVLKAPKMVLSVPDFPVSMARQREEDPAGTRQQQVLCLWTADPEGWSMLNSDHTKQNFLTFPLNPGSEESRSALSLCQPHPCGWITGGESGEQWKQSPLLTQKTAQMNLLTLTGPWGFHHLPCKTFPLAWVSTTSPQSPDCSICLTWLPHSARYLSTSFKLEPGGCLCMVRSWLSDQRSAHTSTLLSKQIKSVLSAEFHRGTGQRRGFAGSAGVEKVRLEPKTGLVWCWQGWSLGWILFNSPKSQSLCCCWNKFWPLGSGQV